jgi:hypothetical protein
MDTIADLCMDVQIEMDRGPSPALEAARARLKAALDAREAAGNPVCFDIGPALPDLPPTPFVVGWVEFE